MKLSKLRTILLRLLALAVGTLLIGTGCLVVDGLRERIGKADVALVLGSKVELDGTPSVRLRARLDRALELYQAGCFPEVIVSGGLGREGYDEAAVMRDYLVSQGIPTTRVILDSAGNTTFDSAKHTRRIADQRHFGSVFVISQYFHVPRSRMAVERFGMATVYSAHARLFEVRDLYSAPRELLGYLSYLFRRYEPAEE